MAKILLVNNAEPGITEFADPIKKIIIESGANFQLLEYKNALNFDFDEFDGAILTGSPQGDDIVKHHLPYFLWVKNFAKPIFGICAGHHVIGVMYGAKLLRSKEPESGDFKVEIVNQDPLLNNLPKSFTVRQMHNDSITLPHDFQLLASSKSCKNQLMKHQNKIIYTSQFHPEFYNRKLLENFIQFCE
jgi:GMP synthase (glutamine-hydrolysing)